MPPCFQLQYGHPPRNFPGAPHVLAAPPASQLPSPVEDPRRLRRERERSSGAAQRAGAAAPGLGRDLPPLPPKGCALKDCSQALGSCVTRDTTREVDRNQEIKHAAGASVRRSGKPPAQREAALQHGLGWIAQGGSMQKLTGGMEPAPPPSQAIPRQARFLSLSASPKLVPRSCRRRTAATI